MAAPMSYTGAGRGPRSSIPDRAAERRMRMAVTDVGYGRWLQRVGLPDTAESWAEFTRWQSWLDGQQ
jgi:hypothetical protein